MANSERVQFFDIPSTLPGGSKSWSPNTLRVRTVLNFKGIPYTQSWISYPDIKPLIQGLELPPNETGLPYTLPAIIHKSSITTNPNGAMMDSLPIVLHLDKQFPSPPLFPSGDASFALTLAVDKIVNSMRPAFWELIISRVAYKLDPRGKEYFIRTRSEWSGKPYEEILPKDPNRLGELYKLVDDECATLAKMLKGREGKKGPFFEGEKPGFADLSLASRIAFIERFDTELFQRIMGVGDGELKELYDACYPWLEGQGEEKEWPVPQ